MPGRILIVDDNSTNRILLRVRLAAAFYDVLQAGNGAEALEMVERHAPDLVLLSAALPDCDSLDLCRRITGQSGQSGQTAPPPVLIVAAQADRALRLAALEAGAEDVLHQPLDDLLLQARLRSLMRVSDAAQELHLRDATSRALGFAEAQADPPAPPPRICILTDRLPDTLPWRRALASASGGGLTNGGPPGRISFHNSQTFQREVTRGAVPDLCVIVMERATAATGLRLLAGLRAHPETRHAAVMAVLSQPDSALAADALDLGAGDVMAAGVDPAELELRMQIQLRRKRRSDQLRSTLRDGLRAAVTDPLTGLYNRRYAMPHLARMTDHAAQTGRKFAVMAADLDHFKTINDRFGHATGDAVLVEVARRLRGNLRAVDLVARIGGEEFLIALPDTDRAEARVAARRLCRIIAQDPFELPGLAPPVTMTISIGLAMSAPQPCPDAAALPQSVQTLLERADRALYAAKAHGRNQVVLCRTAPRAVLG